ncbi:MAG: hypothetical protein ACODAJ_11290 [Planctomycetota bacterium]
MEQTCPVCGHRMAARDVVCPSCRERMEMREPRRREQTLYAWGRGLMACLAAFLFVKAAFAVFEPGEYRTLLGSMGYEDVSDTFLYLNAAFVAAAALLYAVAWLGGYLALGWEKVLCGTALAVFVVGQAVTQFLCAPGEGALARPMAVFIVWLAVPVFQCAALLLGRQESEVLSGEEGEPT